MTKKVLLCLSFTKNVLPLSSLKAKMLNECVRFAYSACKDVFAESNRYLG